jgi:hypothetical protein
VDGDDGGAATNAAAGTGRPDGLAPDAELNLVAPPLKLPFAETESRFGIPDGRAVVVATKWASVSSAASPLLVRDLGGDGVRDRIGSLDLVRCTGTGGFNPDNMRGPALAFFSATTDGADILLFSKRDFGCCDTDAVREKYVEH